MNITVKNKQKPPLPQLMNWKHGAIIAVVEEDSDYIAAVIIDKGSSQYNPFDSIVLDRSLVLPELTPFTGEITLRND